MTTALDDGRVCGSFFVQRLPCCISSARKDDRKLPRRMYWNLWIRAWTVSVHVSLDVLGLWSVQCVFFGTLNAYVCLSGREAEAEELQELERKLAKRSPIQSGNRWAHLGELGQCFQAKTTFCWLSVTHPCPSEQHLEALVGRDMHRF